MLFDNRGFLCMTDKIQDLAVITPKDVNAALVRDDPDELELLSITLALSDLDFRFCQSVCITLASGGKGKIRGNALVSLGHLARRYRALDEASVKPLLESGLADFDAYVRMSAKSASDEIHQFLHWNIKGHVYG
jgi:hypothetical protein